ncbi:hypothetical protein GOP47_0014669 [Adiantum capillus-veneris]|uniref:Uncharacterized protein n=1 Tax=Adiantum capillus-veneris TaxID=13818 RepID=A0A9D4UM15_ADICA|nr:hypothetical protein GOP47_0014669 [Adiantum capillus-veneris]
MDKRSWPWKKKLGDKNLTSTDAEEVSTMRHLDDQAVTGSMVDNFRISNAALSPDQADEKIRILNERLLAADHLVKQHVKVAEEAVSGWEKSKAENLSLKHQLEQVMEQKQVSDDRASNLDGALKESMWQLRQIREEQEQRIHDAIVKKTRDWENLRLELQQRLADADHQLVEAEFQNSLLFKRAQEQAEAVLQLGEARSQAEAKIEMLQVRLETYAKENASLKYEVMVLNKELTIRNQERDINKKSLDVASRQKIESARKINKLESECQRLRALVRKKLPGPGALVQMKLEAEGLDAERGDLHNKWRQGGKTLSSPRAVESMANFEGSYSERVLAMEEETKMLKEVLAERNSELQTVRITSAQMAEKLSFYERQQAGQVQNSPRKSLLGYGFHGVDSCVSLSSYKEPSHASRSEDGADDERSVADSWASALISELSCFQKERVSARQQPRKSLYSQKASDHLDSTDDFIEVERLVSSSSEQPEMVANKEREISAASMEALAAKEAELQAASMQCAELKDELFLAEGQLSALSSKNAANELNLFGLQQKLNMVLTNLEVGDEARAIEEVRNAVLASQCSSVDGLQAHVMKLSKVSSSSVSSETPSLVLSHQRSLSPTSEGKSPNTGSELSKAVSEVVRIVEELVFESKSQQQRTSFFEDCQSNEHVDCTMTQKALESNSTVTKFKSSTDQFLQGKVELVELMGELSSVLSQIRIVGSSATALSQIDKERHKREASKIGEQEVFSDAGSPFSNMSNCDGSELPAAKVSPSTSKEPRADDELRKLRAEKAALGSHMKAELSRMDKVEEMLVQLQQEKSQLGVKLEEEKEKLEATKSQLLDDEQLIVNLRVRLASAESSKNMADQRLTAASAENSKLVLQLQECQTELTKSNEMLKSLEKSIDREQVRSDELQAKVEELQGLLERANLEKSQMGVGQSAEKNRKEEGIANATERLAECQRTILVLGKQIQNMTSARASQSSSLSPSAYDRQENGLSSDDIGKYTDDDSPRDYSRRKQSIHSDSGDFSISNITDAELFSGAKAKGKADTNDEKQTAHDRYIESSPKAEGNTQIVPYVPPQTASGKKSESPFAGAVVKSLNMGSSAPSKRGNSLSRFFTRNKKTSS